jgi:hypothetical protein
LGRRNKPKNNLSVRRQQGAPSPVPVPAPVPPAKTVGGAAAPNAGAKPIGWTDGQSPMGPPPAYPGMGHNSVPGNGAPPAYSPGSFGSPPSYSALLNRDSHIGKIPPRGQPSHYGSSDHTSFVGLGNGHGGPSYTGINGPHVGGYSGVNSGVGGVGMTSGGYGNGYGYGQSSPFSFGNMLTGLALWQVARGFNSYPRERTVHVYDHRNETTSEPQPNVDTPLAAPYEPTAPQQDPYAPFNPVPYNSDPFNPAPHNPEDPYNQQYPVGPSVVPTPPPVPEFNVYGYGYGYPYGDQNNKSLNIVPLPQSDDSVISTSSQSPQSETDSSP